MKLGETDSSGRKRPVPIEGSDYFMACDNVILAIGQSFDLSFIGAECDDLQMTDREHIVCDPETGTTSAPDIFVAGDLAHGPKLLIHAVASGKRVARTIYEKLTAHQITAEDMEFVVSPKEVLLAYSNPSPSIMTPSAGYTFAWSGLFGAGGAGNRVKRFRMEPLESDRVEGEMTWDQKVIATDLGGFLAGAIG